MLARLTILCSIIFLIWPAIGFSETTTSPSFSFISMADIHFDPFIGCESAPSPCPLIERLRKNPSKNWETVFKQYGNKSADRYYQDTNYALLKKSFNKAKEIEAEVRPQFILILGDFLAHHYKEKYIKFSADKSQAGYIQFVKKTMEFLNDEMKASFPHQQVYPIIGNNDSYSDDYSVVPNGEFLKNTITLWSNLISNKANQENFKQTFSTGGYYSINISNNKKIIFLNTVLFSRHVNDNTLNDAAENQLTWLHKELESAASQKQRVLLAFHVPFGIDVTTTIKNNFDVTEFWKPSYTQQFKKEIKRYSNIITGILPAHIHTDTVQRVWLNEFYGIPVSFTPSISPLFGNNPGFKVYYYNEHFQLEKFDFYSWPLNTPGHQWRKEYGVISVPTTRGLPVERRQ